MNPQSFTSPGVETIADFGLSSIVFDAEIHTPDRPSMRAAGAGRSLTCSEVAGRVRRLSSVLIDNGVAVGDRVAVLGRTGLDWAVVDLAVLAVGAVVVPVYPTASAHQIEHVVTDSGAVHFVAESADDAARLTAAGADSVWLFATTAHWAERGGDADPAARIDAVQADDLALIVYTSGTTGPAKGCMLTHRNMHAAAANTVKQTGAMFRGTDDAQAVTAIGLPLAHVFGQTILFATLVGGTDTHLVPGIPDLVPALPDIAPTFLALVPYALEKIRKAARPHVGEGAEDNAVTSGLELLRTGVRPDEVHPPLPGLGLLGGRLRHVISGGASLDESTAGFYAGFGVTILNCYGMTETATAATVNNPETNRLGTVGRPIPGTTIAIGADGEVLVRGDNVTRGYWGAAASKTPVDSDGWLHTGDVGEIDRDGYLRITGRMKEILVTSGGKNVAPTPLEDRIRLHPLVSNAIVLGDGRSFVTALITLDPIVCDRWGAEVGIDDPRLIAEARRAVDDANTLVSRAESIREFRILPGDFTVDNGLLTSSLKLRRAAIESTFESFVSEMYSARV